jgi:hypothetical protein
MMLLGFAIRPWNVRAAITYLFIWCLLFIWSLNNPKGSMLKVMWAALNTGRPTYSAFRWRGNRWSWFWTFFNIHNLTDSFSGAGTSKPLPAT